MKKFFTYIAFMGVAGIVVGLLFSFLFINGLEDGTILGGDKDHETDDAKEPEANLVSDIKDIQAQFKGKSIKITVEGSVNYSFLTTGKNGQGLSAEGSIIYANDIYYFKDSILVAEENQYYKGFIDSSGVKYLIDDRTKGYTSLPMQSGDTSNFRDNHPLVALIKDINEGSNRLKLEDSYVNWEWEYFSLMTPGQKILFTVKIFTEGNNKISSMEFYGEGETELGTLRFQYEEIDSTDEVTKTPAGYSERTFVR